MKAATTPETGSFDRLAPHYRWMEAFLAGPLLQRCRLDWLPQVRDARRVLSAGEGNGRFLFAAVREMPEALFTCLDASAGMLGAARARLGRKQPSALDRVEFVHADLLHWQGPAEAYDLIATHFFLDCFPAPELPAVIRHLSRVASMDARWLLTDFHQPAAGFAAVRARAIVGLAYACFRAWTGLRADRLAPPASQLESHGFRLAGSREHSRGLLTSQLWVRGDTGCGGAP